MHIQQHADGEPSSDTDGSAEPAAVSVTPTALAKRDWSENAVAPLLALGAVVIVAGLVAGLAMALHAKVAPCEDGHYFPPGTTDFRCYVHPHAITGSVIVGASIFAAIVLALIGIVAHVVISARDEAPPPSDRTEDSARQPGPMSQL
ncbi:MAG TPA: hypothetical protein VH395_06685 [Jatrophihabitantaceae bacterium]